MSKKRKKSGKKKFNINLLKQINFNAAGIDIGDSEIFVAVPEGRDEHLFKGFETFTQDLHNISKWLKKCEIDTVAMESTGVYWIPLYDLLEREGFEVYLVDSRKTRNVTGRKSDIEDCQWIQQLHTYGLLSKSFRPSEDIRRLRDLVRHRENIFGSRSTHIQRMQKHLQLMNIKLTNVITDITGTTGMKIIRSIVKGEREPRVLAQHRDPRCKKSTSVIIKSLEGNYQEELIFILKQELEFFDFYTQKAKELDKRIENCFEIFEQQVNTEEKPLKPPKRPRKKSNKNAPDFDLRTCLYKMVGVDLTRVDGLDTLSVQDIVSTIGTDMSLWKTHKYFTSWLKLSPNNKKSGGKILSSNTLKIKNKANKAFKLAALSLSNSESALGAFYRRMRTKHGAPIANTATAHKLARIVYKMLKYKFEYEDLGADYYEKKYKNRVIKNLKQRAKKLGFELIPKVA